MKCIHKKRKLPLEISLSSPSNQQFYRKAGVPSNQIEDEEFVFKIDASCYMTISVPGSKRNYKCPGSIKIDEGQHFKPPLGQSNEERLFDFYIPDDFARRIPIGVDLGIAYGILMPGVAVKGEDEFFTFDVAPDMSTLTPELTQMILGKSSKSFIVGERFMRTPGFDNTFGPFDIDSIAINLGRYEFDHLDSTPREHKFKVGKRKEN